MYKQFPFLAACILAAFALVFSACKDPLSADTHAYTVSFDKNHTDADTARFTEANPNTKTVSSPATTVGSLPANPTRHDFIFGGWNTLSDGTGAPFTANTPVTADIRVYAQWDTEGSGFAVKLNISGKAEGDSVTLSPTSGAEGDTVTINYTVISTPALNNRLVFSGVISGIEPVTSPHIGTRTYTINKADASNGTITINATFFHSNKLTDIITFPGDPLEEKTYGDGTFTKALSESGSGTGAISYSSSNTAVAIVDSATGKVTIVGAGNAVISATKESDGDYEEIKVTYTLNIAKKELTIGAPDVETLRQYDGTKTAKVTAGSLAGKVGSDDVSVTAAATYNSANVGEANLITVVYEILGDSASNYIKPDDYTISGTISRANGIEVAAVPTSASGTPTSITLDKVILLGNSLAQTVEYACSTTAPVPTEAWQDMTSFTGLTPNETYYFFARSKENDNYNAGTPKSAAIKTEETIFDIVLEISGKADGDSVTLSPSKGKAGVSVTINYTVANSGSSNNRLSFSGTNPAIAPVTTAGTGTTTYTIKEADAGNGTITIKAMFYHANLEFDIIEFTGAHENKTYGDGTFTKALSNTGSGSGTISYSSGTSAVATVNNSGLVTILKDGTTVITATKASDGTYASATDTYTLTVAKKQLTMSGQTVTTTKQYTAGNTSAAVTAGTVNGKVGTDTVSVTSAATYNSANVADANLITVAYTLGGADSGKYIKPADYTLAGTITKASGIAMGSDNITAATTAQTSVTLNAARLTGSSTVQTVEYASSTTNSAPSGGWQDGLTFNNLTPNTTYYFFARSKENANYNAGTAKASAAITTLKTVFNVELNISGNTGTDSVTRSPASGSAGDAVTISYTVANSGSSNNRLTFSGVNPVINPVNEPGTGTRTYTINEAYAVGTAITINATFTHTNLQINTIAFTNAHENKTYGDGTFTNTLANPGAGNGTISYSSGTPAVATVNNSGLVTILKDGTTVITATKASDGTYASATDTYTLTVAKKQLGMSGENLTTTKQYNGSTSATFTAGAVSGKVGNDTVSVATTATYNSASVADANRITVAYTLSGADSGKYIKPADYTLAGTITKANGIEISTSNSLTATTANIKQTSVTLTAIGLTGGSTVQTVEYARASTATPIPTSGWQDGLSFDNLTPNTAYYFFARSKGNANYNPGTAKASAAITTLKTVFNVALSISGNTGTDSVTRSPASGSAGEAVTISYTLGNSGTAKNELIFSGVSPAINSVTTAGTSTRTYTINEADAESGTITIKAAFNHVNLTPNTITFGNPTTEDRIYSATTFTKALNNTGSGTGAISYASSDTSVAEVTNNGTVTMKKNGTTTITATKASDGTYASATASYVLNVAQLQLTIANPSVTATKAYDGTTTAAVTAGSLTNKLSADTVTVTAVATYNSADVGTNKTITVVYGIGGADAGKYIKPVNYTVSNGTINKASGTALSANPTAASRTPTSVTLNAATLTTATGQTVEYAHASTATPIPTSGWQDGVAFTGLTANTNYYFFARSKENTNYNAGAARTSAAISTNNLTSNTIAFTGATETKTYGDTAFTKALTTTGSGNGATTWSSDNTAIATVNSSSGQVTIVKAGSAVITATKASDGTYAQATATYTLTVNQRQLTKANPTVTPSKTYDGNTTAAVTTVGALNNVVSGDTVTVSATATYNTADVGTGKTITVVYEIAGASASNYLKPANYTVTNGAITKASGSALNANPTAATTSATSITLTAATLTTATGQAIEYARNTSTTVPTTDWQESTAFTGLTANTTYYFFARSKDNTNYNAGAVRTSAAIKTATAGTPSVPPTKIDFENDAINKTYSSTKGGSAGTMTVIADPVNSGQKSLRIVASGYNQAAIIPVPNLPYALQNYATLSFRINITSGNDLNNKPVLVYAAGDVSAFKDHGFGNPADSTYPQFAANLAGQTPATDFSATTYKDKWTTFTITLSPGSSIGSLKGNFFIAFGFNSETATYLVDDLVFTIKDSFTPPVIPPAPSPPSTGAVASGNYRNLFSELGKSSTEITAKVNTTWNRLFGSDTDYKVYYEVAGDMAYIYDSGNDDVRSEGMSYGMMMAVQMNKQTEFNKLWRWAKTNMYNETNQKNCRGYFAWQCGTNGNKKDAGCAPDGEFYFATALLFAHARWGSGSGVLDYRKHAMQLLYDMIHRTSPPDNYGEPAMFRNTDYNGAGKYMTVFQPQGSAGEFTDPSYHLPAFYEVWAIELEKDANAGNLHGIWDNAAAMKTDAAFYRSAVAASRGLFKNAVNATTGLGPDYSHFTGTAYGSDAHSHFEYDAFRTVMNAAMDYSWFAVDSWQKTYADTLQSFFHSKGVNSYTALWTLTGTSRGGDHSPGLIACNAVASLAATNQRAWDFLDDFWEISMTPGKYRYYDGCLYMLGLLHVTGNFKAYLSSGTYTPNPSISPTSATFDKRSNQQQDIVVTLTLNGNTLSNIRNGATTLTSGTNNNYTLSGSTVTIRKEYLATLANGTVTLTFNFSGGSASTISITIDDTTPSASISPTTAIFDKRADLRADIPVTMTLNGYTFTRVQNGAANLTSGTDYIVSGNTVTLKTSYLAGRPNGTTTLTFVFSGGSNKDIAITIRETAAGATPGGGTKIDFSTMSSYTAETVGNNVSATLTGGKLRVKTSTSYTNAGVVITLDLGSQTLGSFSGVRFIYQGVDGDTGYKNLRMVVAATAGGTPAILDNSSNLKLINDFSINGTAVYDQTVSFASSAPLTRSGEIKVLVGIPSSGSVTFDITLIELIP